MAPDRVQTQRAPSTSMHTPLMKAASSLARYSAALATSSAVEKRPSGMVARNFARRASSTGPPANSADRPVSGLNTGLMQLTRMLSGPSSAAIDLLVVMTAPLEPLYQVSPGRGRNPAVEAMLMKLPVLPPGLARMAGTAWIAVR